MHDIFHIFVQSELTAGLSLGLFCFLLLHLFLEEHYTHVVLYPLT